MCVRWGTIVLFVWAGEPRAASVHVDSTLQGTVSISQCLVFMIMRLTVNFAGAWRLERGGLSRFFVNRFYNEFLLGPKGLRIPNIASLWRFAPEFGPNCSHSGLIHSKHVARDNNKGLIQKHFKRDMTREGETRSVMRDWSTLEPGNKQRSAAKCEKAAAWRTVNAVSYGQETATSSVMSFVGEPLLKSFFP